MEKFNFWLYATLFLVGFLSGVFVWEKIDVKTIFKGKLKIKQRGKGNVLDSDLELNLPSENERDGILKRIKSRRQERKEKRQQKRG